MKGCLIALGIIVAIFLTIAGIISYKVYNAYNDALAWTSTTQVKLNLPEFTPDEEKIAEQKFNDLKDAINKSEEKTLEFTANDINILIKKNKALKDHALITIQDGYILADVSMPLSAIPGFKDRYLNGSVKLTLEESKNKIILKLIDIKTDKKTPPPSFLKTFTTINLLDSAYKNKDQSKILNKFKSAVIEGDKIIITLKTPALHTNTQKNIQESTNTPTKIDEPKKTEESTSPPTTIEQEAKDTTIK